jgi:hypothetical protein
MPVQYNKKYVKVATHNVANETYVIVGNNSVSNIAMGDEIIEGATISRITYGTDSNGTWKVLRGANVVFAAGGGSADHEFPIGGLSQFPAANVVVQLSGSANGFIQLELKKIGTFNTEYLVE